VDTFGHTNKTTILSRLNARRRSSIGLRIAPLVDMIFLLLIFFLVAAKWRPKEDFLPFQLPVASAGTQTIVKPEPLIIRILATQPSAGLGCQVQIGSSYTVGIPAQNPEQGLAVLMEKIRQCLLEQKRYASDPVEITCAADVKWEYLAKIYNVLVGMGLTDITFRMTERPGNASAD
jgi:biopolymer transport protein ExbD